MPYLPGYEQKVFYTKRGHGTAPALLLVHGAGGSHLDWPIEIQRLENTVVYSIDLPGHGRSGGTGKTSIAEYAHDVIELIQVLGLEEVVIAGYSMGGAVALEIGRERVPGVCGLVLISTGAYLPVGDSLLELISTDYPKATDLIVKLSWSVQASKNLTNLAKDRLLQINQEVTLRDFTGCNAYDLREEIASIDLPTLVISGLADRMAPADFGRALAEGLPNARYVEVDGGSHMVFLEKPAVVAGAIADFMTELRQSRPLFD